MKSFLIIDRDLLIKLTSLALVISVNNPEGVIFDGTDVWVANSEGETVQRFRTSDGRLLETFGVSIITFNPTLVTTVTTGFNSPLGILYDGDNIWVTDVGLHRLHKLDASGNIVQSILVGGDPRRLVFDGINIWVPNNQDDSVSVVRVKDNQGNPLPNSGAGAAFVLATLTGNGMNGPDTIAFDGERMLVTNIRGDKVSLFKAADLSELGSISTGAGSLPLGACSDGMNFWVTFFGTDKLARF